MAKNMRKTIVQAHYSSSVQKTAHKNTKYSRNESILKIGHLAKAIDLQNGQFASKNKLAKNIRETILRAH